MTPGVHLQVSDDGADQKYVTPETAVMTRGADIVIVGRGVTQARDVEAAVVKYKHQAWSALAGKYLL